jgi:deoxyribodipyrimidine photolyase-like uncharacterized protein
VLPELTKPHSTKICSVQIAVTFQLSPVLSHRPNFLVSFATLLEMAPSQPAIYRLKAKTQSYDWGKLGDVSKVAEYAKASGTEIDASKPYAEVSLSSAKLTVSR